MDAGRRHKIIVSEMGGTISSVVNSDNQNVCIEYNISVLLCRVRVLGNTNARKYCSEVLPLELVLFWRDTFLFFQGIEKQKQTNRKTESCLFPCGRGQDFHISWLFTYIVEQRTAGTSSLHAKEIIAECYFLI